MVTTYEREDKEAETLEEAIEKPHRATAIRGGIYPVAGAVIGIVVLIVLVVLYAVP